MFDRNNIKNVIKCLPDPLASVNRQSFLPNELSKNAIGCFRFGSTHLNRWSQWVRERDTHINNGIMWCKASNIVIILAIYLVFASNNFCVKCFDKLRNFIKTAFKFVFLCRVNNIEKVGDKVENILRIQI